MLGISYLQALVAAYEYTYRVNHTLENKIAEHLGVNMNDPNSIYEAFKELEKANAGVLLFAKWGMLARRLRSDSCEG